MAGQPSSVNQIGFDFGHPAVGDAAFRAARAIVMLVLPPGAQDPSAETQGLPYAPSVMGVRVWRALGELGRSALAG